MVGETIKKWLRDIWEERTTGNRVAFQMSFAKNATELEQIYSGLTPEQKEWSEIKTTYPLVKAIFSGQEAVTELAMSELLVGLDALIKKTEEFQPTTPGEAKKKLAALTTETLKIAAAVSAGELLAAKAKVIPAETTSSIYHRTLTWMGFGALLTAVAHDPVKIGFLRPYNDALEMTFRNRRPGDEALFQAYRTRELTPTKADPSKDIPDQLLDQIEDENQKYYDREIAKWGYSEWFAGALARSATRTPTFGNLTVLARQGILTRGLAVYSLWGYGMDRLTMRPALDALMALNDQSNYGGFRGMIEPAYAEGEISQADLVAYWKKIAVPEDVQKWVLPHLTKKREAYLAKQKEPHKDRDLTVSQISSAFVDGLIDRTKAQNMLLDLKPAYEAAEVEIILELAEKRKKLPGASKLKRLPLSDYEKAYKNKIISLQHVMQRMEGEYTKEDIELEEKLLKAGKA